MNTYQLQHYTSDDGQECWQGTLCYMCKSVIPERYIELKPGFDGGHVECYCEHCDDIYSIDYALFHEVWFDPDGTRHEETTPMRDGVQS